MGIVRDDGACVDLSKHERNIWDKESLFDLEKQILLVSLRWMWNISLHCRVCSGGGTVLWGNPVCTIVPARHSSKLYCNQISHLCYILLCKFCMLDNEKDNNKSNQPTKTTRHNIIEKVIFLFSDNYWWGIFWQPPKTWWLHHLNQPFCWRQPNMSARRNLSLGSDDNV